MLFVKPYYLKHKNKNKDDGIERKHFGEIEMKDLEVNSGENRYKEFVEEDNVRYFFLIRRNGNYRTKREV